MAWWRRPRARAVEALVLVRPSSSADAPPSAPAPLADPPAPPAFTATFFTSAGDFSIRSVRSWSPAGVDRLYRLLREGHYNDTRVYRVVPSWVAQFGYSGDPALQRSYTAIADDPRPSEAHNKRGFISYSSAVTRGVKNSATERATELFINLWDHWQLDWLGFTPIAVVIGDGMDVVNSFFNGYGEMADACNLHGFLPCDGPVESRVLAEGNAYLDRESLTHANLRRGHRRRRRRPRPPRAPHPPRRLDPARDAAARRATPRPQPARRRRAAHRRRRVDGDPPSW